MKKIFYFLLLTGLILNTQLFAQATFEINESGDTINYTDENGLKQGVWDVTERNIRSYGTYVDDVMEGSWRYYYPRGFLSSLETYQNGKKNGVYIGIDRRGYITKEEFYVDDKLEGPSINYKYGGNIISKVNYKNGIKHGKSELYYENSTMQESSFYLDGERDGLTVWYDQAGNKIAEFQYQNGVFDGVQKTFYPTDTLQAIEYYENNIAEGEFLEFHENGEPKTIGQFENGQKTDKWLEYDKDGVLMKETKYKDGEVKSEKVYFEKTDQ